MSLPPHHHHGYPQREGPQHVLRHGRLAAALEMSRVACLLSSAFNSSMPSHPAENTCPRRLPRGLRRTLRPPVGRSK